MTDGSTVDLPMNTTTRWDASCTRKPRRPASMIPVTPLKADTYYAVVADHGLTASGALYKPSYTWGFIRQANNPVEIVDSTDDAGVATRTVKNQTPFSATDPAGLASIEGIDLL